MWTPFKHLQSVVEAHFCDGGSELGLSELEVVLRRHKQNFSTLLKNPVSYFVTFVVVLKLINKVFVA